MLACAEPVKVVEHSVGRGVPTGAIRCGRLTSGAASSVRGAGSTRGRSGSAGQAEIDERPAIILARSSPGGRDMRVDFAQRRLSKSGRPEKSRREKACQNQNPLMLHNVMPASF